MRSLFLQMWANDSRVFSAGLVWVPGRIKWQLGRTDRCCLLERLEHEELLEDLGLTGLPDLPCQEHLIHHRVHL